jgi:hypothetical protein
MDQICTICRDPKPEDEFYRSKGKRMSRCRDCHKKIMRPRAKAHYQENKSYYLERNKRSGKEARELIQKIKEETPCADCGNKFPYYVMDFDHVRGEKLGNISEIFFNLGRLKLEEEIKKCDVVCSNCHRVRSFNRMRPRQDSNPPPSTSLRSTLYQMSYEGNHQRCPLDSNQAPLDTLSALPNELGQQVGEDGFEPPTSDP